MKLADVDPYNCVSNILVQIQDCIARSLILNIRPKLAKIDLSLTQTLSFAIGDEDLSRINVNLKRMKRIGAIFCKTAHFLLDFLRIKFTPQLVQSGKTLVTIDKNNCRLCGFRKLLYNLNMRLFGVNYEGLISSHKFSEALKHIIINRFKCMKEILKTQCSPLKMSEIVQNYNDIEFQIDIYSIFFDLQNMSVDETLSNYSYQKIIENNKNGGKVVNENKNENEYKNESKNENENKDEENKKEQIKENQNLKNNNNNNVIIENAVRSVSHMKNDLNAIGPSLAVEPIVKPSAIAEAIDEKEVSCDEPNNLLSEKQFRHMSIDCEGLVNILKCDNKPETEIIDSVIESVETSIVGTLNCELIQRPPNKGSELSNKADTELANKISMLGTLKCENNLKLCNEEQDVHIVIESKGKEIAADVNDNKRGCLAAIVAQTDAEQAMTQQPSKTEDKSKVKKTKIKTSTVREELQEYHGMKFTAKLDYDMLNVPKDYPNAVFYFQAILVSTDIIKKAAKVWLSSNISKNKKKAAYQTIKAHVDACKWFNNLISTDECYKRLYWLGFGRMLKDDQSFDASNIKLLGETFDFC